MSSIKYRYALDENDKLVDIQSLERATIDRKRNFFTLDFKQPLIAKLGLHRVKHFAIKSKTPAQGNQETYLHALGKKVFLHEYQQCLKSSTPFKIKYEYKKVCNRLEKSLGVLCTSSEWKEFNLVSYFTDIKVEKRDGNFIPDLLLLNPNTGEKIYVEIAVTHFSSEEKIESGHRIIEFTLESEEDIDEIKKFGQGGESDLALLINFNISRKKQACKKRECQRYFYYFIVSHLGRSRLFIEKESKIIAISQSYQNPVYSLVEPVSGNANGGAMFKYYMAKAHQENIKIKNCFLCRYHGNSNSKGFPIFCKFLKKEYKSSQASECEFYRIEDEHVLKYLNYPYILAHGYPEPDSFEEEED